ncbi:DUF2892 domain-containing protein [Fictibacillus aquaticus]|uniref:Inner membrane protein YgaP-like transmembrane domain-containing protein n=1 Tax=Fictibacillus aquaticus TaxID=2021314 RepID=A0A235F650_9BACL|nr:DUF2892 domain-containing protein [Fictibacillus aquaticus]OYD56786.1 hypothetical protein CGZ90_17430 [Fictibacillus aquaticus]
MRQNIGLINAMIRIAAGLTMVAVFAAKFSRRPYKESYIFMILMGAMKVAEGIVRFCPVTELFHTAKEMSDMNMDDMTKEGSFINPS